MTVSTVRRDDVEIAYETFGPASGEPLLLVMGTGGQMLAWHPDFCGALLTGARRVGPGPGRWSAGPRRRRATCRASSRCAGRYRRTRIP